MGNRDKGNREVKKPKKVEKAGTQPLVSGDTYTASVDVVPRKRKPRTDDE